MKVTALLQILAMGLAQMAGHARATDSAVVDDQHSPFAQVRSVGLSEVRWTGGFWADRYDQCRTVMIPSLERLMQGTNYSQFYRNFEIAAGLLPGRSRGASFNDGECYKLLEAASATLAVTNDPVVSTDMNHTDASATVALPQTQVIDGRLARVLAWYDNEWGFSTRMADTALTMAALA